MCIISVSYYQVHVFGCNVACFTQDVHTHTRLTALCPGLPGWAGTRKIKPIWILQDNEWQWNPLGHMHICTSLQTDNHASTPPLSFLQAGCPSCRPTNSVKALKAKMYLVVNCFTRGGKSCLLGDRWRFWQLMILCYLWYREAAIQARHSCTDGNTSLSEIN